MFSNTNIYSANTLLPSERIIYHVLQIQMFVFINIKCIYILEMHWYIGQ